ncbi:MAG: 50S ribosomal protein L18e [Nitrososphaerota archaeon]|nr:50S ribosomal protein L18e [Candidatus Bathyarchaeota archaeon]MDW8048779.1 50S ribosomal protein L18e [Nitrososphaerota archaeon]
MSPKKRLRSTNPELINIIRLLEKKSRENDAPIWRDIAERLSKPRRRRIAVNVSRINRYALPDEEVVVPGKVLGAGKITHPVKVAALSFSEQARLKIMAAKGKCLSIPELIEMNPKGSRVRIIG